MQRELQTVRVGGHRGGEEAITIRIAGYLIANELYRVGIVTALRFSDRDANIVKRRAR